MSEQGKSSSEPHQSVAAFPSTHWSVILLAGAVDSPQAEGALNELCRTYWTPLYAYLRREGHPPQDAEDLVQGFLARVIAREDLANLSPEKGRFRTFLLTALRNFSLKHLEQSRTLKRGGGQKFLTLNREEAERLCGPDLTAENPERAFDRRWCRTVLAAAWHQLEAEYHARDRSELFQTLSPFLDGVEAGDYDAVARQLRMAPNAVAVTVHRMRVRLRELVRAEISRTVGDRAEAEAELKHLLSVWERS